MDATPLEPDDVRAIRWEVTEPVYRVDFWHRLQPSSGVDAEKMGYKQDSYELRGALDISEVQAWSEKNAAGRTFVIYIVLGHGERGPGVVQLLGSDPTAS